MELKQTDVNKTTSNNYKQSKSGTIRRALINDYCAEATPQWNKFFFKYQFVGWGEVRLDGSVKTAHWRQFYDKPIYSIDEASKIKIWHKFGPVYSCGRNLIPIWWYVVNSLLCSFGWFRLSNQKTYGKKFIKYVEKLPIFNIKGAANLVWPKDKKNFQVWRYRR